MIEIERKFLIQELPDLEGKIPLCYTRYFISEDENKQIRVQRKGNRFELETKTKLNELKYRKTKTEISEENFLKLSSKCTKAIIRDSYLFCEQPNITLKIYHGTYEGLIRAEIEYDNIKQVENYNLPDWFGTEITGSELASDNKLIKLSRDEFLQHLKKYRLISECPNRIGSSSHHFCMKQPG